MEITKGENANLAGMEPRCPKCGSPNFSVSMVGRDNQIGTCGKCDCNLPVAQFFRSPAPTPSLDVEAAAQEINEDEITRIRTGRSRLTEKGIADILRRHIASPAPRSCPKCGSPMCQPYKSTDDDLWTQRCNKCEWFEKWSGLASPAQPEKRDE